MKYSDFNEGSDFRYCANKGIEYFLPCSHKFVRWFQTDNQYGPEAKWYIGEKKKDAFRAHFNRGRFVILASDGKTKEAVSCYIDKDNEVHFDGYGSNGKKTDLKLIDLEAAKQWAFPLYEVAKKLKQVGLNLETVIQYYRYPVTRQWLPIMDILTNYGKKVSYEECPELYSFIKKHKMAIPIKSYKYVIPQDVEKGGPWDSTIDIVELLLEKFGNPGEKALYLKAYLLDKEGKLPDNPIDFGNHNE